LSFGKFEGVIKKMQVDSKIISEEDIRVLFDKFKEKDDHLDYRQFVQHLKDFELPPENIYVDLPR
jgi:hypothetical protein